MNFEKDVVTTLDNNEEYAVWINTEGKLIVTLWKTPTQDFSQFEVLEELVPMVKEHYGMEVIS